MAARPTETLNCAKTDFWFLYCVSSYVQNRFESQLLVNFRADTFPEHMTFRKTLLYVFCTEDLLFSENMTFQKT